MEKFIVSARKYRPQTFDTVVGQEHITTTLKNAIKSGQLAHSFLFCGPRGVGKTTCARILAKTINCENPTPDGEACNVCTSCVAFNSGASLNIHELDAASNNSVDDIRTLVDQVRYAPQSGKYKVYIIDEVHMLSSSAFNAFLKTLEEPPPYAIFILATTEKHKILPTILSRCQIFDFRRITLNDTVDHLKGITEKEHISAEETALQLIAQKSEGCMRDSLSILDKIVSFTGGKLTYENTIEHLNILDEEYYFKLIDFMLEQDLAGAMLLYDEINKKGFEGDMVLNGFAEFIRNLLICKDPRISSLLEVVENFKKRYTETAQKADASYLVSALNILNEAEISYKQARNKRLHVELALIKLCYLAQALELTETEGAVQKKKMTEGSKAIAFKNIQPIALKSPKEPATNAAPPVNVPTPTASPKLVIETPVVKKTAVAESNIPPAAEKNFSTSTTAAEATAVKAAPSSFISEQREVYEKPASNGGGKKLSSLEAIRQKVGKNAHSTGAHLPLTPEALNECWQKFIELLKTEKNPAWQGFSEAMLQVIDDCSFEVVVDHNINQKFLEMERAKASEYLQQQFNNRLLQFTITLIEGQRPREESGPVQLTLKEQYVKLVENYPLVKELKDRLKLQLDY
ncbi:MAG: DNA polymerase III subunit gamma/tau [Flavisolibacter sp.]